MRFLDKLHFKLIEKRKEIDNKLYKIKVESEQQKADKIRKKKGLLEPGTFAYGLYHRQNPIDFAKDVIDKRRNDRMLKNGSDKKG